MGFFTVGNLLTLAIVGLVLILYRQFDRQSRTLDKIHKYADRLKEELSAFVAEKEGAVRDYGIALKVQQDAAKELMKRLQMTDEELAEKVSAVAKIDERISAYDSSLEELVRMTGRVQENLNRIRDESAFVEKVHKRISDTKTKIDTLESEFESLLPRFEQENAEALERVSGEIIASVKSSVSDLGAQLETIERQVEDHREAITVMERTRADNLDRDMALINNALKNAVEQAGLRADKIEESALIKLREQAQERIRQLHDLVEEKLKAAQESAREQILDVQGSIRVLKDDWQSEYAVFEVKRRAFKEEWLKDAQEFKDFTEVQWNAMKAEISAGETQARQLLASVESAAAETQKNIFQETGRITEQFQELQAHAGEVAAGIEANLVKTVEAGEARVLTAAESRFESWKAFTAEAEAQVRRFLEDFETSLEEAKRQSDNERLLVAQQLKGLEAHTEEVAAAMETRLAEKTSEAEAAVVEAAVKRLEEWQTAVEAAAVRSRQLLVDFEAASAEAQNRLSTEIGEIRRQSDAERFSITQQLKELENRIGETALGLEERLTQSVAAAEAGVTEAAAKRLEEWQASVEAVTARSRQLLIDFEAAAAESQTRFNTEITETKRQGDAERLLLTQQLADLEAHIGEAAAALEERLTQSTAAAEAEIAAAAAKRFEEWRAAVEAADLRNQRLLTDFEAAASEAQSRFNAEIAETKQQRDTERILLAQQLKDLEAHVGEAAAALEERLTQSAAAAEAEVTAAAAKRLEEWQTALEAAASRSQRLLTDFEAAASEAQSRFNTEIAEAKEQRDTEQVLLAQQLKELETHIEEATLALEERLTQSAAAAEAEVTAAGAKRLEEWQLAVEAAAVRSQRLLADFETAAAEAQGRFTAELEEAQRQRDTERFLLSQQLKGLESHTDEAAAALEKRIAETAAEAEKAGAERLEAWHTALETAAAQSQQLLANFEASFSEARARLIAEMEETKQQSQTERLSILQQLQDIENHIEEASTALEERLIKITAAAEAEASETGTKRLEEWRSSLEAAAAQSRQFLADFEAASSEAQARLEAELGETKRQSEGGRLSILQQMQDLENHIKEASAALEERLVQTITAAEAEVSEAGMRRLEEWRSSLEEAVARSRQFLADFEAASSEAQARLEAEFEETKRRSENERLLVVQQLKELETHTGAVAGALEERLTQTVTAAEAEVTGAAAGRLKDWEAAAEAASVRSQQLLKDFETAASAAQVRFDSEIGEMSRRNANELGAVENRLENLQRRMDEVSVRIEADLSKVVKEAEEKALVMAEAGLEKWLTTVEQAEVQGRKLLADLEEASAETEGRIAAEAGGTEKRLRELQSRTDEEFAKLEEQFIKTVEELEQRILEEAGNRLEEYRAAQSEDFKRLETLADDAARLDGELRFSMNTVENRIREDFLRFEQEAAGTRETTAAAFNSTVEALKADLNGVEQELAALKARAYENVSEKLDVFEADFSANLTKRGGEIDKRLTEWQESLDLRLLNLAETSENQRRDIEHTLNEEVRKQLTEQNERLYLELDRLKAETGAFEEGIRNQMRIADDSLDSFKEQLDQSLQEVRASSEAAMKTEVGRYGLTMADVLKQQQRELETRLKEIAGEVEERNNGVLALLDASRREIEEWQSGFSAQLREVDLTLEDTRRRAREMVTENDERLSQVRSTIEDVRGEAAAYRTEVFARTDEHARTLDSAVKEADRHIKEFVNQTKLFDRADELKLDLERRIEDLRSDLDGLDQRRAEAAQLESQFVKIKRLEDEVNFKMTRFLSEKHRIEQMESDFNRLLQTSKAVEEKLVQVSSSDDTLQAVQIQIRRLDDALASAEEKYQRIEKKNQTLDETNDSIDQNFKALQESEHILRRFNADLQRMTGEMDSIRNSVENLGKENEKARETAEKLILLEASLSTVEERISKMQVAREWLARTETRLEELNKDAQEQVKLMGALLKNVAAKGGGAKEAANEKGTLFISDRDNVVKLARQGWTVDEIARTMKISRGEVELILEMEPKN